MTLPHREWNDLHLVTLLRSNDANRDDRWFDWTDQHLHYGKLTEDVAKAGNATPGASVYQAFHPIFKPKDVDFALTDGMDECVDYGWWYSISLIDNTSGQTSGSIMPYILHDSNQVDYEFVTGQFYDGVAGHYWSAYPPGTGYNFFDSQSITIADLPLSDINWCRACAPSPYSNLYQEHFFKNGVYIHMVNWVGGEIEPFSVGKACTFWINIQNMRVNYLNPVVNSLNRRNMPESGEVTLVLTGLGFDQADTELGSQSRHPQNVPSASWNSIVDYIDFIGQQGQGTTTLQRIGLGEFTIDSDTQITISSMPALAPGTYTIQLRKNNVTPGGGINVSSYVGDWNCDSYGFCRRGTRFTFFVGEDQPPIRSPVIFFKWRWKLGGLGVDEFYAPIGIRAPETFWEGRVLNISSIKRSIDDFTGMYSISDMEVELASADKHFQQNLALGHCKNQVVEVYQGWSTEPASWQEAFFFGIVDDYTLTGPVFNAVLKDISRRHFRKQMPRFTITSDEYPNAPADSIGKGIPEILGLHNWTVTPTPGAIEAPCVNTSTFQYVAAAAPITPTQVYSNNSLQTEGAGNDYTISYGADGHTYIDFNANQGNNKVTFNCTGYEYADWNSANGYVQNPVRVLEFFLAFINEIPIDFIDTESFNDLADRFDDNGYGEAGRLACTKVADTDTYLQELLFSFGIKMWPDKYGRLKVGRKDITNYETDRVIWAQTDAIREPSRPYNLKEAINYVKARSDYQPACSMWRTALEREWGGAIEDYEQRNEAAWDYPWVSDEDFLVERMAEDLGRLAYGRRTVTFPVSLNEIGNLDIFDNFRLQDPYGISASGAGNVDRYYYITALNYDWMNHKVTVEAEDLQWLIGQCFLIAHCDDIPDLWADASDWQRMFGYIGSCTTDAMPDGQPLKKICSCD